MSLALPGEPISKPPPDAQLPVYKYIKYLLACLSSWEIYLVLLIAVFLRFYQLGTSEFDGDQAAIFSLAREAIRFGLLPIVSNQASIGIQNPPAVIYLLMIPAALSADPLWATIMVGLFNTCAVLLTYFFTRRYYGRLAAIIASLLYAAAAKPLNYSRFIWQQNMLAPIILLFLFILFRGVVERRKGWFFPAVLLLGIAYQLHETSTLLAIPLLLAVVLAPGTLRWRDVILALAALVVLFSPYILWEYFSHFADVAIVLNSATLQTYIDTRVIYLYQFFLSPNGFGFYYQVPQDPTSLLRLSGPLLPWLRYALWLLVAAGLVLAGGLALWPLSSKTGGSSGPFTFLRKQWADFRASPYRCGLLVLLVWQVVPILLLLRHAFPIFPYYLLILMPGPFILAAIFIAQVIKWVARPGLYWRTLRYGIYAIALFVVVAQIATCTASLVDVVDGTYKHGPIFNDLGSLEHALSAADHLARQRHLSRVYISTDAYTQTSLRYLAGQMQTPVTLFDDTRCLVLPSASAGPAVMLVSPYAQLTLNLLHEYAKTSPVGRSARLGAPPFQLYIVTSRAFTGHISSSNIFTGNLQFINLRKQQLDVAGTPNWLVSRWTLLRARRSSARTTYNYAMVAFTNANAYPRHSLCTFTAIRPGDQMFVAFALPNSPFTATLAIIEGQFYTTTPYNPSIGFLHLETGRTQDSPAIVLLTTQDKDRITAPLS